MNRIAFAVSGMLLAGTTFAQQTANTLGTKPEVLGMQAEKAAPLVDAGALLQLAVALAVVYVLIKYAFPRLISKFGSKLTTQVGSTIKTCETAACGTSTLQVIEVRGKTLLVAANPTGVTLIADLSTAITEEAADEKPAFFEMLDARRQEPLETLATKAVVEDLPDGWDAGPVGRQATAKYDVLVDSRMKQPAEATRTPKADDFEESLRLLTEARAKMESRAQGAAAPEPEVRRERLRRLTG